MKGRAVLLFIWIIFFLPAIGFGQEPPFAEILTADSSWCQQEDNLTVAEILITGDMESSRFDLVVDIKGTRDTLLNLSSGIFTLFLNNQTGANVYIVHKIIEHQTTTTLENDVNDTLVMEVNPWPVMTFNAIYDTQCSPTTVTFNAQEGYPSYTWEFGDGSGTSTSTNWVIHTYSSEQAVNEISFETGLKVVTAAGCRDSVTDNFILYPTPNSGFQVDSLEYHYPNTTVKLTNTTSAGDWSFVWDFGDRSKDYRRDPIEHEYATWGMYDIVMEWSSQRCSGSVSKQVEILPPKPVAVFSPATSGCPPLLVSFTNNSLYADSYLWDFDDGSTSTKANPSHSFHYSKAHHVKLLVSGPSGTDSTEQVITIFEPPLALFEPSITETDMQNEVFTFYNNSENAVRYLWDFGDGQTSEEQSPEHVFSNSGSYTISLYAWSGDECVDTLVMEDLITITEGEGGPLFPTVFRWNGSGPTGGAWTEGNLDNTVFHPKLVNASKLRMVIFTRLGHRVFESNEVHVGWDGYINFSELAVQGVYVYKAWITYSSGKEEIHSGDVTFIH